MQQCVACVCGGGDFETGLSAPWVWEQGGVGPKGMHLAKKPHFQCPMGVGISPPHPVWDCFTPGCGTEHPSWRSAPVSRQGPLHP